MSSEKTGCGECPQAGLPITIQVGDLAPQIVAHIEHTEGEPIEQFQARLASVLLQVALGVLSGDA